MDGLHDFNLHGIVGVRVTGGTEADVAAVHRQLGGLRGPLDREPDIVVSFVAPRPAAPGLRYLDLDDAAFDDEAFYVVETRRGERLKARVDFDRVDTRCEIECESGIGAVPLLIAMVNLCAISRDVLPVHASAFTYDGRGMLVTGWSKGGKTETLLAFMAQGATYVGDEWIYLAPDGRRLYGLPQPITVWDWHLPEMQDYQAALDRAQRAQLRTAMAGQRAAEGLVRLDAPGAGLFEKVGRKLERQRFVHLTPEALFGASNCVLQGEMDKLVFVMSHESREVAVRPIDGAEVARRMAFSLDYERRRLVGSYLEFRFAFPDRSSALVEDAPRREREMLLERFSGVDAVELVHPFPPSIPSLFEALAG